MISKKLSDAREYENKNKIEKKELKPVYHLAPQIGWMNDPNGFSYYKGKYHLFYQYNPYETVWGPMHWGHAVSEDLIKWTSMPCSMAPDMPYDEFGCFSGSAIEIESGEHLIMYTGVQYIDKDKISDGVLQNQSIAIGDGVEYKKIEENPVLSFKDLPIGSCVNDFRDPKIWRENNLYYAVIANCTEDRDGQILLYSSLDALKWNFEKVLLKNNGRFGKMWECPDFFSVGDKHILILSPQDMEFTEKEFMPGNGTVYFLGEYKSKNFVDTSYGTLDSGIDYYAPQTTLSPDGRRISIAWMQNWDSFKNMNDLKWFGQMSFPRELSIKNDKLIQKPIREIENYYESTVNKSIIFEQELKIDGVNGRCFDMDVEISSFDNNYEEFEIQIAKNEKYYSFIKCVPKKSEITIDRTCSGVRRAYINSRTAYIDNYKDKLKLRLLVDHYSLELFINEGEKVMSMTFYTDISAKEICFKSKGKVNMDLKMHKLKM